MHCGLLRPNVVVYSTCHKMVYSPPSYPILATDSSSYQLPAKHFHLGLHCELFLTLQLLNSSIDWVTMEFKRNLQRGKRSRNDWWQQYVTVVNVMKWRWWNTSNSESLSCQGKAGN